MSAGGWEISAGKDQYNARKVFVLVPRDVGAGKTRDTPTSFDAEM